MEKYTEPQIIWGGGKVAFINAAYFSGIYDETLGSRSYGSFTATPEFGHLGVCHMIRVHLI